jgi:hypothetical protein
MAKKKKTASNSATRPVKRKPPARKKKRSKELTGPQFAMFADSREQPDIPVFVEYVVDVPRAVMRGNYMVSDGNAMNVWITQTIEHLTREA